MKNIERIKFLISLPQVNVNAKDNYGRTPFFISARVFQSTLIGNILLSCDRVDANASNNYGWTVLHDLVQRRIFVDFKRLLQSPKININAKNKAGETPFHFIMRRRKCREFEILMLKRPDLDINALDGRGVIFLFLKPHLI